MLKSIKHRVKPTSPINTFKAHRYSLMQAHKENKKLHRKEGRFGGFIVYDNKKLSNSFLFLGSVFLTIYTLVFLFLDDATKVTMSFMGNNGHRIAFILWGVFSATLITQIIVRIFNTFKYHNTRSKNMLRIAYLSLIACVLIPSLEGAPDIINKSHFWAAAIFVAMCLFSLLLFVREVISANRQLGYKTLLMYIGMLLPVFLSYIVFGHSGIYEIVFFVCLLVYLVVMYFVLLSSNIKLQKATKQAKQEQ